MGSQKCRRRHVALCYLTALFDGSFSILLTEPNLSGAAASVSRNIDIPTKWIPVTDVRLWPIADMAIALHMSAFGGKADMTFCAANVR
jgi:hypothetical protein